MTTTREHLQRRAELQDWVAMGSLDRVLDQVEAWIQEAKVEVLRKAADEVKIALQTEVGGHTSTYSVRKWLHEQADQVQPSSEQPREGQVSEEMLINVGREQLAQAWDEGWMHYRRNFQPTMPGFGVNPYRRKP